MRLFLLAGTLALGLGAAAIWVEPYRRARFFSFLNPTADPQGAGYQIRQAMIGVGSGGITGDGLGQGDPKIFYLPEAHTDMIAATIGEELGLIGSTLLIAAFVVFAWAGFRVALTLPRPVREAARRRDHDARLRPGRRSTSRRCSVSRR